MRIGVKLCSEERSASELVDDAARAEEAGFNFAAISDHFHPWIDAQGESPFVWGVLGGIATATDELEIGTAVTCPTVRMHPAVVAHAAATAATMMPGRFFLGVGTGEWLNEHITGSTLADARTSGGRCCVKRSRSCACSGPATWSTIVDGITWSRERACIHCPTSPSRSSWRRAAPRRLAGG